MRQAGFTLLELLIGLSLMGLLALVLAGSLRSGLDVTDRVGERAVEVKTVVEAHALLRRLVDSAVPLRTDDAHGVNLRFQGNAQSLNLVAPSGRDGSGGLIVHRLAIADGHLVAAAGRQAPRPVASLPPGAAFAYFGAPDRDQPEQWLTEWSDRTSFPLLVRLRVPGWPDAVARPRMREAIR